MDSQILTPLRWRFFGLYGGGFGRMVVPTIILLLRVSVLFGLQFNEKKRIMTIVSADSTKYYSYDRNVLFAVRTAFCSIPIQ